MSDPERLRILLESEPYWTAHALKVQGSRFYRALGDALDAADAANRRKLFTTWTDEIWEFYRRGQQLAAAEAAPIRD